MNTLKAILNSYSEISERAWSDLSKMLELESLKKGDFYTRDGRVCSRIGFINSGIFAAYYKGEEGVRKVVYFNFVERNPIVSDFESFITNKPGRLTIQAIADCEILSISRDNLYRLYDKHPSIERMGRVLAEKHYLDSLERITIFQAEAKGRYKFLLDNYPTLILKVPAKLIASYLDITDSSFSRLKRNMHKSLKKLS